MAVPTPKAPTHAVKHIDNWDGERNVIVSLAFNHEGVYLHYESGKPLLEYVGDEILQEWPLTEPCSEGATQQQRLRLALTEATDTLERELLPALEDKEQLIELIEGFRAVAAGGISPKEPMLQVLVDAAEQQKFEQFRDMNTMLVFMAGCAVRERMDIVSEYKVEAAQGSKAAQSLLVDEEKIVRDYCRVISLCEQSNPDDVQSSFEAIVERAFKSYLVN